MHRRQLAAQAAEEVKATLSNPRRMAIELASERGTSNQLIPSYQLRNSGFACIRVPSAMLLLSDMGGLLHKPLCTVNVEPLSQQSIPFPAREEGSP